MQKVIFLQSGYAHYRKNLFLLLAQQHDITYVFNNSKNTYPGDLKLGDIPHIFIDKHPLITPLVLFNLLIKEKPDVVITSWSSSMRTIITYFYSLLFHKKFILWEEDWKKTTTKKLKPKELLRTIRFLIGKKMIKSCDALIAGGTASSQYAASLGKDKSKIFLALQCTDDIAKRKRHLTSPTNNKLVFLYLSRILDWKGLDLLLKAFSKLEMTRSDVSLLVAGDGPFKKTCLELSRNLQIVNVDFIGSVDPKNINDIFSRADIFVLPSCFRSNTYEAWGLVINEAMSMGLPIITTNAVGASYDMVENKINGIIAEAGSDMSLYNAMKEILDLDLKKMGKQSRFIFEQKNQTYKMANGFTNAISHVEYK